jgi:hypothetical protein
MTEQIEDTKTPARPWLWPSEWFKDEKFWREVTARAMSGVIVLVLAALGAVAAGLIVQPYFMLRMGFTMLAFFGYLGVSVRVTETMWFQRIAAKPLTPARKVSYSFAALLWLAGLGFFIWAANVAELY